MAPDVPLFTSCTYLSSSDTSRSPSLLLRKLRDLDLSNVEATPHVKPCIASPLPPTTLEDVHPQAQSPGTYLPGCIPSQELTTSRPISIYDLFEPYIDVLASTTPTTRYYKVPYFYLTSLRLRALPGPPRNLLKGHHLFAPATTRSFLSSVAVPVAPFELQPAPSMLQHKPSYTKPYPKTYSDPGLTPSRQLAACLSDKNAAVHLTTGSGMPNSLIVFSRILWFTLSKKPEISNVSVLVTSPWLCAA
ncbi:hypothetical protein F5879DRAFT_1075672 [Lentinula edodes]|nr:hypothetical protein F5879DRAFT_1075672 [Lentinula edodes]